MSGNINEKHAQCQQFFLPTGKLLTVPLSGYIMRLSSLKDLLKNSINRSRGKTGNF
jgi:hypothetical protein